MTREEAILYLEKMKENPNVAYKDKLIIALNELKQENEQSILDREIGGDVRYTDSTDWKG